MADNVRRLLEELPRLAEAPNLASAVMEFHELAKVGAVGKKAWPDPEVYEPIKTAFEQFRAGVEKLEPDLFRRANRGIAGRCGSRPSAVARGRRNRRRLSRTQTGAWRRRFSRPLDLRAICCGSSGRGARLRQRYRYLLLDELQDTDPVQMEFVELLCGAGLTAGKLFAVGDANQSIYRFRGADVHLFQGLRNQMAEAGRLELTHNYRSQPQILYFANALFQRHLDPFAKLEAVRPQINPGACVEFLWTPRPEKCSAAQSRMAEAQGIAERIAALVRTNAEIVVKGGDKGELRPVAAGDVVLLFRAMTNVSLYETALRNAGLDYYLVGGRAFFATRDI